MRQSEAVAEETSEDLHVTLLLAVPVHQPWMLVLTGDLVTVQEDACEGDPRRRDYSCCPSMGVGP